MNSRRISVAYLNYLDQITNLEKNTSKNLFARLDMCEYTLIPETANLTNDYKASIFVLTCRWHHQCPTFIFYEPVSFFTTFKKVFIISVLSFVFIWM